MGFSDKLNILFNSSYGYDRFLGAIINQRSDPIDYLTRILKKKEGSYSHNPTLSFYIHPSFSDYTSYKNHLCTDWKDYCDYFSFFSNHFIHLFPEKRTLV